jgi:hypothetical protein
LSGLVALIEWKEEENIVYVKTVYPALKYLQRSAKSALQKEYLWKAQ